MGEEKKTIEKNHKIMPIGNEMVKLIEFVEDKFEKEYGLKPNRVEISNLIAKRVLESELF